MRITWYWVESINYPKKEHQLIIALFINNKPLAINLKNAFTAGFFNKYIYIYINKL